MSYKLYLKEHNITGFKYLGYTSCSDPYSYRGSGKHWRRHIKTHGYNVTTTILLDTSEIKEIQEEGKRLSELWDVVKSKKFANLKIEEGDGGFNHIVTKRQEHLPMWVEKGKKLGATRSNMVVAIDEFGNKINILKSDFDCNPAISGHTKGFVTLYDEQGNPVRKRTGEFNSHFKGNNCGKIYITNGSQNRMISKNDVIEEGWYIGDSRRNPNQGKIWINNGIVSKMINGEIPDGWQPGRLKINKR